MKFKYLLLAIICMAAMPLMANIYEEVDTLYVEVDEIYVEEDTISSVTESLPDKIMTDAVDAISRSYPDDWKELSMQGKLNFEGLPVRPTLKIYMKRGESILMSARAPIVGEVARIEMCNDSITIINKHSKKYWSQSLSGYTRKNPDIMSDIQDIFLGDVAFPGRGRITPEIVSSLRWIVTPENDIFIYPTDDIQFEDSEYGLILDPENFSLAHFVLMLTSSDTILETSYLYGDTGWTLGLEMQTQKGSIGGEMLLSYPDYAPTPLEFTNAGRRYARADITSLLKF